MTSFTEIMPGAPETSALDRSFRDTFTPLGTMALGIPDILGNPTLGEDASDVLLMDDKPPEGAQIAAELEPPPADYIG